MVIVVVVIVVVMKVVVVIVVVVIVAVVIVAAVIVAVVIVDVVIVVLWPRALYGGLRKMPPVAPFASYFGCGSGAAPGCSL